MGLCRNLDRVLDSDFFSASRAWVPRTLEARPPNMRAENADWGVPTIRIFGGALGRGGRGGTWEGGVP